MHRRHKGLRFEWLRGRIFSILVSGKVSLPSAAKRQGLSFDFTRPFLAMASLKTYRLWAISFGLTKKLDFIRPFLAMASLKANHSPTHELILLAPADKDMMTLALRPPPYMDRPLLADSR